MIGLETIAADLPAFKQALVSQQAYKPLSVKIKLIFGCNLRCEMCNHWRSVRPPPLSMQRWAEILTELAGAGCQKIHLSGGEPLLRAGLPELVAHAVGLGLRVTMTTNGTLLDKAQAKDLVQAGLRGVNISLDAPDRKLHDTLRGVPGAWKKACRAVEYFQRYASKGKLTLRVNTVVSRQNYTHLAAMPDFVSGLGAQALNLIGVDDHCGEHLGLHRRHILEYNTRIAPALAERALALGLMHTEQEAYPFGRLPSEQGFARRGDYAFGYYRTHPCFAPWTHSLIDYDGKVFVCCMTRERITPLGDLRTNSFSEIWQGEAYRAVRGQMDPPRLAACRSCDDFIDQNAQILAIVK